MRHHPVDWLSETTLRIMDAGARGNLCPQFLPVAPRTEIVGFEVDKAECERLNTDLEKSAWLSATVLPYALGRTANDRVLYVTRSPDLTSLLRPNPAVITHAKDAQVVNTPLVNTISLDDLYRQEILDGPFDFVKLDTQGSELEILQGGEQYLLPSLLGVEIEVEFTEAYIGQPRFSEVEIFLREHRFQLYSMTEIHDHHIQQLHPQLSRARTSWGNAVFFREEGWLASLQSDRRQITSRKLMVLYALYGLFSASIRLADNEEPEFADKIRGYFNAVAGDSLYWRLALIRDFINCLFSPSRRHRQRLAQRAMTVMNRRFRWMISTRAE